MLNRRSFGASGVCLAGLGAWFLLASVVPIRSERLWLLLPPLLIGLMPVAVPERWALVRTNPGVILSFGGILALGFCGFHAVSTCLAGGIGVTAYVTGGWWLEPVLLTYVVLALVLAVAGLGILARTLLTFALRFIPAKRVRTRRVLGSRAAGWILIALPVIAWLIAVTTVHRLKIPVLGTPEEWLGRAGQDVTIVSRDGTRLRGWFLPAKTGPSRRTVMYCHGLAASRLQCIPYLPVVDDLGANLLTFDFRSHGGSDGHTVSMGIREQEDVLAAIEFLRREKPGECQDLIGFGVSMGAASLILAGARVEPPLTAVVVDSGFAAAVDIGDTLIWYVPGPLKPLLTTPGVPLFSWEADGSMPGLRPVDVVDNLRAPVVFVHASGDGLIPVSNSHRLYERAAGPKRLWVCDAGWHTAAAWAEPERYRREVGGFLAENLGGNRDR